MLPDRVRLGITEPGRTPPGSPEYDMDRDFGGNLVIDPTNYSTNNNELDNLLDIVRELFYILRDNSIPTLSTRNAVDSIVSATRQAVERAATATADCGSVCGDDGAELDGAAMPQPTPRRQACAERAASPPPIPAVLGLAPLQKLLASRPGIPSACDRRVEEQYSGGPGADGRLAKFRCRCPHERGLCAWPFRSERRRSPPGSRQRAGGCPCGCTV